MKRWRKDINAMRRQQKLWKMSQNWTIINGVYRKLSLGRFRKRHALDCGNAKCMICHQDKLLNYPTRQELVSSLGMKEQLSDI